MSRNQIWRNVIFVAGALFIILIVLYSDTTSPKVTAHDQELAESFLKFNILTHDGMSLGNPVPHYSGKDRVWSESVNRQFDTYLSGNPLVEKLPGSAFVFAYKLAYIDGRVRYIVWYDDGTGKPITGPDITITLPVGETPTGTVITERVLLSSEEIPLTRGYLEEDGVAKITINSHPVFVYPQPE